MSRRSGEPNDAFDLVDSAGLTGAETARLLARCRAELLVPAFGDGDLVDPLDNVLPQYRPDRPAGSPVGLLVAARGASGRLGGCLLAELFPAAAAWIVTYVVVAPTARRGGLARRLLHRAEMAAAQLLPAAGPTRLFAETEFDDGSADAAGRLRFLSALGFRRLGLAYVQPALASDRAAVASLHLLAHTAEATVPAARVADFLEAFYASIAGSGWRGDPGLCAVLEDLERTGDVATEALV